MNNNEQFNLNQVNNVESVERKRVNPILLGILFVLLLGIFGVGGWILGTKYAELEDNKKEETKEVSENENVDTEKDDSVSLTESEVKNIYSTRVPILDKNLNDANAYQNKKIDVNNLNESLLRGFAFWNIDFKEGDITSFVNEDGSLMCDEYCSFDDLWGEGWYIFDAKLLQDSAKELYGREIPNGDFADSVGSGATYTNGEYHHSAGGGTITAIKYYREFVTYEEVDDTLVVTDKFIKFVVEPNDSAEDYVVKVYTDSNNVTLIDTTNSKYDAYDEEFESSVIASYKDKMVQYKHTFKQDDNGNWYWVSTEPIK